MCMQVGQVTGTLLRLFKGAALVEGCELAWGVGPESARRGSLKKSDCEGCGDVEPWVWVWNPDRLSSVNVDASSLLKS